MPSRSAQGPHRQDDGRQEQTRPRPRPRLLCGRTRPRSASQKRPVKRFDLQKQPNATRKAPEAHRVPPSRTAKDAEAEDSDEDEYLHGADQHEGLAQFINRSRDYEPALPADVVRYYMREAGASAADDIVGLVAGYRPLPPSLINEAGEAAALRGDSADGGRRVLRTADVMAALQQRGVDAMNGSAPTGGKKRARGA